MLQNDISKWRERMHSLSVDKAGRLASAATPSERHRRGGSLGADARGGGGQPPKNIEELRRAKEFITDIVSLGLGTGLPLGELSQEEGTLSNAKEVYN